MARGRKRNRRKRKAKRSKRIDALSEARKAYRERGDASSCGDWLALALKKHFQASGGFDLDGFARCLKENGIDWKIDRSRPGWVGRFRMNGRQKLAAVARRQGYILIGGRKIWVPGAKRGRWRKTKAAEASV